MPFASRRVLVGICLSAILIFNNNRLLVNGIKRIRKSKLTFVNGIGYKIEHVEKDTKVLSKMFGGKNVDFCHNPTGMSHEEDMLGYFGDLTQAGTQKLGYITKEVDSLVQHLKDALATVGSNGRVIHIAHSQGVLITYLASKKLTPTELSQIEVIAFGGAAAIRKTVRTPYSRCINYYASNDPLLLLVPQADQALRSGFVGNSMNAAEENEFCFLVPRVNDPVSDHALVGPTYAQALIWEGHRYQQQYQSIIQRIIRRILLIVILSVQVIFNRFLYRIFIEKLWRSLASRREISVISEYIKLRILVFLSMAFSLREYLIVKLVSLLRLLYIKRNNGKYEREQQTL